MSPGPLRRRIGWRDELRHAVASSSPCRVVEGRQILPQSAALALGVAILAPVLARDRALLVGISRNQARIDCKAFSANQVGWDASFDDTLEHGFERSRLSAKKIEMRFAHLKRILRLGRLRPRGPRGAQDEFVLAAIAQNLRRLATLFAPVAAAPARISLGQYKGSSRQPRSRSARYRER